MNLRVFARLGRSGRRLVWGGALTGLLLAAVVTAIGDVSPEAKRARAQRTSVSLFAGPTAVLRGNQLQCGLDNQGNVCTDVFNSPTGGGGFWPTGSPNAYIFNTGLQIAGIMGADGGPWANDTVGALIFDASGLRPSGTALTNIYNSLDPDDVDNWPAEAYVNDPDLFYPVLLGRKTASQQDSWVRYWDGDPSKISGRQHPMGVAVTQRSLAWNYPAGNESLIYFIYNFENATDTEQFQSLNETLFFGGANELPDSGITLNQVYAAFSTDMDVGNASDNFSTAVLPFDLGMSYLGGFQAESFVYTPDLFYPPFFTDAPGIIGVKYLKSPENPNTGQQVGLTLFSNTINGGLFGDPSSDKQLWRYLSGKLNPDLGDEPCNVTAEIVSPDPAQTVRSLCYIEQNHDDTRFYQASGPFTLAPDGEGTIVVAYIAAATVATMPDGTPSGIIANSSDANANRPGYPSFHPGFESARGCDVNGQNCTEFASQAQNPVKAIERGAGWYRYKPDVTQPPGDVFPAAVENPANKVNQNDVEVVPGSLLGKALVAQTIFDNKFLLGFAPDQPTFHLLPGDTQVTVLWEPSATDADGDPFYAVASDPESDLYNPNYREFDVEGYRIWRGSDPGNLSLLTQFDKKDTEFVDFTCETVQPTEEVGVELDGTEVAGYAAGETCPDGFEEARPINDDLRFNNGRAGGPPGLGVVRLNSLAALATGLIRLSVDEAAGPGNPLNDSGIPYVYVDDGVTNNFTYFYAVSAFDVNSPASGPASLRSSRVSQSVVPRRDAPNREGTLLSSAQALVGDDGEPLTDARGTVQPDAETGIFPGPQNPTDQIALGFSPDPALVGTLVATGGVAGQIDSVIPHHVSDGGCTAGVNGFDMCWTMYLTVNGAPQVVHGWTPVWGAFSPGGVNETTQLVGSAIIPFNGDELVKYGVPSDFGVGVSATVNATFPQSIAYSSFEGQLTRRIGSTDGDNIPGGSRWFDGDVNTTPDPARFIRVGHLEEVDTVWAPIHHTIIGVGESTSGYPESSAMQCFGYAMAFLGRAADVKFTWDGSGGFASVRDSTHRAPVDFRADPATTWGFMNTDANGNGMLDWQDFDYLAAVRGNTLTTSYCGPVAFDIPGPATAPQLEQTATIQAVSTQGVAPAEMTSTGQGFGLYVNGERYIFQTATLPAAGTVWTLRTYSGVMGVNPDASAFTNDPTGYGLSGEAYFGASGHPLARSPLIPNLGFQLEVTVPGSTALAGAPDLTQVHTVPDPYLTTSEYDRGPTTKQLMFVNLPARATVRIYTVTGVLVDVIDHNDPSGGGRAVWDIRNRNNQFVASGVYFFHVVTPDGDEHVGKFTIVNFGGQN